MSNPPEPDYRSDRYRALTREQRASNPYFLIEPGFINRRRVLAALHGSPLKLVDDAIEKIPTGLPDFQRELRIDQIYVEVLLNVTAF